MNYDNCIVRPHMGRWAIFHLISHNRAEIVFEGTRGECYAELDRLCGSSKEGTPWKR